MKRLKLFSLMALSAFTLGSCAGSADAPVITDADIVPTLTPAEIEAGVMTPEVMWKMGRIGSHSLSPDGSTLLYTITYYNMADNKGTTAIFTQNPRDLSRRCFYLRIVPTIIFQNEFFVESAHPLLIKEVH